MPCLNCNHTCPKDKSCSRCRLDRMSIVDNICVVCGSAKETYPVGTRVDIPGIHLRGTVSAFRWDALSRPLISVLVDNDVKPHPEDLKSYEYLCRSYELTLRSKEYDTIHCSSSEYGSDKMTNIAREYFLSHDNIDFVMVHEHGGWYLGYRRDGSLWATANDVARLDKPHPQPTRWSGTEVRR